MPTGLTETRQVEAIVLENEFVVATFVPELGGRLLSLMDKTTSLDCFGGELSKPERLGAFGFGGLEITLDGHRRANALGPVRAALTESGLRISEVGARGGIGFDVLASLGEGAELCVEVRFRNRMLHAVSWNPGLLWSDRNWVVEDSAGTAIVYSEASQAGFAIVSDPDVLRHISHSAATCYGGLRTLPPRWGETLRFSIVPVSGLGRARRVTPVAALGMSDTELVIQPRRPAPGSKLVLKTQAGKTLEAPAELAPDAILRYTFEQLSGVPSAFVILDSERAEVFRFPVDLPTRPLLPDPVRYPEPPPTQLKQWEREPAFRYWVANLKTREAFRASDFTEAHAQAENALLYNGDDPLAWIEKAIAARHLDETDEEAPELPNAHYLAPMEPLLRAEGFLAQAGLDGRTFLAPLAEQPDELVEVACTYIDLGLFEDAARFIDAALTVADVPMLRYLYAYACLATGKMKTDAASAVSLVKAAEPPYPWRPVERTALVELDRNFPGNPILELFSALAGG